MFGHIIEQEKEELTQQYRQVVKVVQEEGGRGWRLGAGAIFQ